MVPRFWSETVYLTVSCRSPPPGLEKSDSKPIWVTLVVPLELGRGTDVARIFIGLSGSMMAIMTLASDIWPEGPFSLLVVAKATTVSVPPCLFMRVKVVPTSSGPSAKLGV